MDRTSNVSTWTEVTSVFSSMDTSINSSHEQQHFDACQLVFLGQHVTRFVILVPLSIFIFYQAFQQWQPQHCFSTTSHSDIFTFHNAAVELFWALGIVINYLNFFLKVSQVASLVTFLMYVSSLGQMFFHVLTCVERYLAVVHPVTYRGLKNSRGNRIRDVSISCVWLLCFSSSFTFLWIEDISDVILLLIILVFMMTIISFCSASVVYVLIRSNPGKGGRDRVSKSKMRAFYTILAILGVIWVWFVPIFVGSSLFAALPESKNLYCTILASVFWFNLPCSLILPILYLHRTGRLEFCHGSG